MRIIYIYCNHNLRVRIFAVLHHTIDVEMEDYHRKNGAEMAKDVTE